MPHTCTIKCYQQRQWLVSLLALGQLAVSHATCYVAITSGSCSSNGLKTITSSSACTAAVVQVNTANGKPGYQGSVASGGSDAYRPKGCYASCESSYTGYFCVYFNRHSTGNGLTQKAIFCDCGLPPPAPPHDVDLIIVDIRNKRRVP